MIQRRTLLATLSAAFVAACARAEAQQQPPAKAADMAGVSGRALLDLTGGIGQVVWLTLTGTVRLKLANGDVRPANLSRAIKLGVDASSARVFDIWQIGDGPPMAAPSLSIGSGRAQTQPNDAGIDSVWLNRAFAHAAFQTPVEHSRLARANARVMAIDATQIWLLEGGVATSAPVLTGDMLTAFEAWQRV